MLSRLRPRKFKAPADHNYSREKSNGTIYTEPLAYRKIIDKTPPTLPLKKTRDTAISKTSGNKRKHNYYRGTRKRKRSKILKSLGSQDSQESDTQVPTPEMKDEEMCNTRPVQEFFDTFDSPQKTQVAEQGTDNGGPKLQRSGTSVIKHEKMCTEQSKETPANKSACCQACRHVRKRLGLLQEYPSRKSRRLVIKNYKLPFEQLPDVVKLDVLSYLPIKARASAALVCHEWYDLLKSSILWSDVDFGVFGPPQYELRPWFMTLETYRTYKLRIKKFTEHLCLIHAKLGKVAFSFDLANSDDQWLSIMLNCFENAQCGDLQRLECNWQTTPARPPCADNTCCVFNKMRLCFRQHISRIQAFQSFLNKVTKLALQMSYLAMPFDWSPRSVMLVSRWKNLETVHFSSYLSFEPLDQKLLDLLLATLVHLKTLSMGICMASNRRLYEYSFKHRGLKNLVISDNQGFYIKNLKLPSLETLKIAHHPWKSVRNLATYERALPCLYSLMEKGTPELEMFNKHKMHSYWHEYMYEELDKAIERVCPCKGHMKNENQPQPAEN